MLAAIFNEQEHLRHPSRDVIPNSGLHDANKMDISWLDHVTTYIQDCQVKG